MFFGVYIFYLPFTKCLETSVFIFIDLNSEVNSEQVVLLNLMKY